MYIETHAVGKFGGPDGLIDHMLDHLLGTEVVAESLGTPNGVLTNFFGTLANSPVPKSRFLIHYTVGAVAYTTTDNAGGYVTGTHINGTLSTFNNATGAFNLTFTTAPDNATVLTTDYIYGAAGADWRLIRHTYAHLDSSIGDIKPVATSATVATYIIGVGNGAQTVFTIASVPEGAYPNGCFPMFSPTLSFTMGGVAKTAHSHAIRDLIHGDAAATDSRLIGNLTRHQTTGSFNHTDIASSTIAWTQTRGVTVTFNTPPTNATNVVLNYFLVPNEGSSCLECIISNTGKNGLNPIYIGFRQTYTLPSYGKLELFAWNAWNNLPANTLGIWSGVGTSRNPLAASSVFWTAAMSMNLYSNNGRVMGFIETQSGYYQNFYVGHFLRACNPDNYTNPILVAGDCGTTTPLHTSVAAEHTIFARMGFGVNYRKYVMMPNNSGWNILLLLFLEQTVQNMEHLTQLGNY